MCFFKIIEDAQLVIWRVKLEEEVDGDLTDLGVDDEGDDAIGGGVPLEVIARVAIKGDLSAHIIEQEQAPILEQLVSEREDPLRLLKVNGRAIDVGLFDDATISEELKATFGCFSNHSRYHIWVRFWLHCYNLKESETQQLGL